jgi:hypothetical protein
VYPYQRRALRINDQTCDVLNRTVIVAFAKPPFCLGLRPSARTQLLRTVLHVSYSYSTVNIQYIHYTR